MKSFTLLEILITVGIIAILISLTIPVGLDFYQSQQLDSQTQGIIQTLRRAQLKAISQEGDSNYGLYFAPAKYILFKGNSYLTRDSSYDEVFDLPQIINVSGIQEVVFSKLEGKPNVAGNIVLNSDSDSRTININEIGRINYE